MRFLTGKINIAPRLARTVAVSAPIPEFAHVHQTYLNKKSSAKTNQFKQTTRFNIEDEASYQSKPTITSDYCNYRVKAATSSDVFSRGFRAKATRSCCAN